MSASSANHRHSPRFGGTKHPTITRPPIAGDSGPHKPRLNHTVGTPSSNAHSTCSWPVTPPPQSPLKSASAARPSGAGPRTPPSPLRSPAARPSAGRPSTQSWTQACLRPFIRGLVADPEAPAGARVRAATALMGRAGLTPAYAVEVRHRDDQQALETTEVQDPEVMARQILEALPTALAVLPPDEARDALNTAQALL